MARTVYTHVDRFLNTLSNLNDLPVAGIKIDVVFLSEVTSPFQPFCAAHDLWSRRCFRGGCGVGGTKYVNN